MVDRQYALAVSLKGSSLESVTARRWKLWASVQRTSFEELQGFPGVPEKRRSGG